MYDELQKNKPTNKMYTGIFFRYTVEYINCITILTPQYAFSVKLLNCTFILIDFLNSSKGPGGSMSQVVGLPNNSYKPITNTAWVRARLCKLQKGCTRLAAASDKVYQLLAHGRWFSPDTPASSTTKTGRHDIAEILVKVALKQTKSNQIKWIVQNKQNITYK